MAFAVAGCFELTYFNLYAVFFEIAKRETPALYRAFNPCFRGEPHVDNQLFKLRLVGNNDYLQPGIINKLAAEDLDGVRDYMLNVVKLWAFLQSLEFIFGLLEAYDKNYGIYDISDMLKIVLQQGKKVSFISWYVLPLFSLLQVTKY